MRQTKGLIQLPQRLHHSATSTEQAFYDRAVQAQQQQKSRDHATLTATLQARAKQEAQEERQWKADERKWREEFERWYEKRQFQSSQGNAKRRLTLYKTNVMTLTLEEWRAIQKRYNHCCAYCQRRCFDKLTKDHIVPISKGGFHTHMNVIPACQSCNSRKGNRPAFRYKPTLIPF